MTNPHIEAAAQLVASHIIQTQEGGATPFTHADDAAFFAQADYITEKSVKRRVLIERAIIRHAVRAILAAKTTQGHEGMCSVSIPLYSISVFDGQDVTVSKSRNEDQIMGALMSTDEDVLRIYSRDGKFGYMHLIYGNDGHDVIADHAVAMSDLLQDTNDFADAIAEVL